MPWTTQRSRDEFHVIKRRWAYTYHLVPMSHWRHTRFDWPIDLNDRQTGEEKVPVAYPIDIRHGETTS